MEADDITKNILKNVVGCMKNTGTVMGEDDIVAAYIYNIGLRKYTLKRMGYEDISNINRDTILGYMDHFTMMKELKDKSYCYYYKSIVKNLLLLSIVDGDEIKRVLKKRLDKDINIDVEKELCFVIDNARNLDFKLSFFYKSLEPLDELLIPL